MAGIEVQLIDQGPARFEVLVRSVDGEEFSLPADHPDVIEIEELAYGRVLQREVRPLPAGTIRVRVPLDEHEEFKALDRELPPLPCLVDDVAERVAQTILA
jgi:hypothetical protein